MAVIKTIIFTYVQKPYEYILPNNVVNGVREASNFSGAQASSKRDVMLPICNSTTCVSRRYITKHKKPVLLYIEKVKKEQRI